MEIDERKLGCLKMFSESLKTTKNEKCVRLEMEEKIENGSTEEDFVVKERVGKC